MKENIRSTILWKKIVILYKEFLHHHLKYEWEVDSWSHLEVHVKGDNPMRSFIVSTKKMKDIDHLKSQHPPQDILKYPLSKSRIDVFSTP
jgi:hypothetical protein